VKKASAPNPDVDAYIAAADPTVQPILKEIRGIIRETAPEAEEVISYRMPAFKQKGMLIFYAAFTHHIGIYPPVKGDAALEAELKPYAGPKGNLKFPLNKIMPYDLIRRVVQFRLKQNLELAEQKALARKKSTEQ